MDLESMSHAVTRLEKAGYTLGFRAQENFLAAPGEDRLFTPEALAVDEVVRFEGASDPDDEGAVFALRDPKTGTKGLYVVAYGPGMDPCDAALIRRLPR